MLSRKRLLFYPPFDITLDKQTWFEGHFQKSAKHKEKTGTAPLAYDGARGRTGQRRARRALSGRAHRIDGAAVVALTLAARPVPAGTSSSSGAAL